MTAVQFPAMRKQVMYALSLLADIDHQRRVWLAPALGPPASIDTLDSVFAALFEDMVVLPDPRDSVGTFLQPGDEVIYLRQLGIEFAALIEVLGDVPDEVYVESPSWPSIVKLAGLALAAMVRRGGWA